MFAGACGQEVSPEASAKQREKIMNEMEAEQKRREVTLALGLRDRIQPYVDGDEVQWRRDMSKEVTALCEVRVGWGVVALVAGLPVRGAELGAKALVDAAPVGGVSSVGH